MKTDFLSQYFDGVALKRLSAVEVDINVSNQHELNGSRPLKKIFGNELLRDYPVKFIWLGDEEEHISVEGFVTWYDAREKHPTRSEWRLYFKSNPIIQGATPGDLLIIAKRPNSEIYLIVVKADSTLENQLLWLFGLEKEIGYNFDFQSIDEPHDKKVDLAVRFILDEIGIIIHDSDEKLIDNLIEPYIAKGFPSTKVFSALARESIIDIDPIGEPDLTLIKWVEQEEKLFRRLEHHIIKEELEKGFVHDGQVNVDDFIKFSLSVQNRRKSRAGQSLENHLEELFIKNGITYSRGAVTENKSKPDFIFPNITKYNDSSFPIEALTMLGVKSTCKDRWRQVLAEADKVKWKHLLTLEPSISENQTLEMNKKSLTLVLPKSLHSTYTITQQKDIMNVDEFIKMVSEKQK